MGVLALWVTGLSACVAPKMEPYGIRSVPHGEERVLFAAPEFAGSSSQRALFEDDWEREEYVLFEGGGARAELIYITSVHHNVALEYPFKAKDTINTWNMSRRHGLEWGVAGETSTDYAIYYYHSFRQSGIGRPCFGFASEWDMSVDDPLTRNTKVLMGYYCGPAGTTLDRQRMEILLDQVGIRGVTERLRTPGGGGGLQVSSQAASQVSSQAAIRTAQGTGRGASQAAETGNTNFPFRFGEYFIVGNNDAHS